MKRMVLIATGLLLLAGSAFAQIPAPADTTFPLPFPGLPDTAYVALFGDSTRTIRQVNYGTGPTLFHWYICFLPSKMGLAAAEFKIQLPANVLAMTVVKKDPDVTIELGTLAGGISTALNEFHCKSDWFYLYHLTSILFSNVESQIQVVEDPNAVPPEYLVATCELGWPLAPLKRFNHLSMNYDGGIGVQSKSWGAIKSLFQ